MKIDQSESEKLFRALGAFKEAFSSYIISILKRESDRGWSDRFTQSLSTQQKDIWMRDVRNGESPENLIDFQHFKFFVINNKNLFWNEFKNKTNNLPTWLSEITEVRNKIAHHKDVSKDEAIKVWIHLRTIAKLIGRKDLEQKFTEPENKKAKPPNTSDQTHQTRRVQEVFLQNLVAEYPELSLTKNTGEYGVAKSDVKGTLWIRFRYEGFRIQTTGELVRRLDQYITEIVGKEIGINNKGYNYWHVDDFEQLRKITKFLSDF